MASPQPPTGTGWTFFKVLGLVFAMLTMAGFGVCGLCGLAMTIDDASLAGITLPLGLVGIAIAVGAFFICRAILRAGRNGPPPAP